MALDFSGAGLEGEHVGAARVGGAVLAKDGGATQLVMLCELVGKISGFALLASDVIGFLPRFYSCSNTSKISYRSESFA